MSACPVAEVTADQIRTLLEGGASRPQQNRQVIRDVLNADPRAFFSAAIPVLLEDPAGPGRPYLLSLLTSRGMVPPCNPALATLDEEVALCRLALAQGQYLERKLAYRLLDCVTGDPASAAVAERTLQVLAKVSDGTRISAVLVHLLRQENQRLRSKAALMLVRATRNPQTAEALLAEPDARVRANAVEALWGVTSPGAREVFRRAADDLNNRVAGNGLLGLLKLGDSEAAGRVMQFAAAPDPRFRATAAWVMGASGDSAFMDALAPMIRDSDARVRHSVFGAIVALKRRREAAPAQAV